MAKHQACHGCLDGCAQTSAVHCTSCVNEPWPCDASRLEEEIRQWETLAREKNWSYVHDERLDALTADNKRLNTLVDTLSRALGRYQDEEAEVGGDDVADHPYQRRGSWSHDDWCAVQGCTSRASAHPQTGGSYEAFLKGM